MAWNFRILHAVEGKEREDVYTIHEVYYDDDGTITLWSPDAYWPQGSSLRELKADLKLMRKAFNYPPLERSSMPGVEP